MPRLPALLEGDRQLQNRTMSRTRAARLRPLHVELLWSFFHSFRSFLPESKRMTQAEPKGISGMTSSVGTLLE
jgi:hypothetical protein